MRLSQYFVQRFLLVTAITVTFAAPGTAQDVGSNPPNASPATGIYSTGAYAPGNIESVNTVNGNVTLKFPLAQLPAGPSGFSAGVALIYNSAIYDAPAIPTDASNASLPYVPGSHGGGWSYGYKYSLWAQPRIPAARMTQGICNLLSSNEKQYWYKNFLQTPDGSNHILYRVSANPANPNPPNQGPLDDPNGTGFLSTDFGGLGNPSCITQQQYTGTLVFATVDNTNIRVEVNASPGAPASWAAYLPDGTRINGSVEASQSPVALSPGLGAAWHADDSPAGEITDRNGNTLSITPLCQMNQPCTDVLTDGQGRTVSVTYISSGSTSNSWTDKISASGPNGTLTTTVNSTLGTASGVTYECTSNVTGYNGGTLCSLNTSLPQVTSIQMPATADGNATTFAFQYAPASGNYGWGELHTVQKCVGTGLTSCSQPLWTVAYDYTFDTTSIARPPGDTINPISKKTFTYTENLDGVSSTSVAEPTYYTIYYPGGGAYQIYGGAANSYVNTITNPDGSSTYLSIVSLCATGTVARDTCSPVVYHVSNPDGSVSDIAWQSNTSPPGVPTGTIFNPYPQYKLETRAGFSRGSWTSQDVNGNVTEVKQYNWTPVSSGLVSFSGSRLVSIGCATGTSVPVCPMQDVATSWKYSTSGVSYWASGTQQFLRAPDTVTLNGVPLTSYLYDNYATTANVTQVKNWDSVQGAWVSQYQSYVSGPSNGNVQSATDPNGNLTATCYDSSHLYPVMQVTAASNATCPAPGAQTEGRTTTFVHDFTSGVPISVTDADNHITTAYTYDNLGRQLTATESGGGLSRSTSTAYDDVNLKVTTTQSDAPQDIVTTTYYDPQGRVRLTTDGDGNKVATAYRYGNSTSHPHYQLQSNPYSASEAVAGWTLTTLDPMGRVTEVDHYSGSTPPAPWGTNTTTTGTSAVVYDQNVSGCTGPTTSVTDEATNKHSSCSDGLGRLISVTEPDATSGAAGTVTSYTYDVLNNLSAVDVAGHANNNCTLPDSTSHMRCFAYSTLSRLVSASNPESGTTAYLYDANGNMTQRTDAMSNVTHVTGYDGLDRPGSVSYTVTGTTTATPTVTYGYDADFKGALSSVANSVSATCYTHDAFGRVLTSKQTTTTCAAAPYTFTYGYSSTDALTSITYPSTRQVTYGLDAADRVTTVKNVTGGGNYATAGYMASGAISAMTMGNGATQTYTWNDRVQPTGLTVTGAATGNPTLLGLSFYPCASAATSCATDSSAHSGNNGSLRSQAIAIPGLSLTQSYTYDHLNRLTGAAETGGAGWTQNYGYDVLGNRWVTTNTNLPSLSLETPVASTAYSSTVPNRLAGWSYDLNGNVMQAGGTARNFTYDAENRQVTANLNGAVSNYSYDGNGLRVSKVAGGQTTTYVYDAWGNLGAEYSTVIEASAGGTPTCYVTADHLGSTRMLMDSAGSSTVRRYDYLPFGQEILVQSGVATRTVAQGYLATADDTDPKFTGQQRDADTGLDWFQVRHMSGAAGRFQSVDPGNAGANAGDPQTWNGYSYVGNNPLSFTDPSGKCWWCTLLGIGLDVAGIFTGGLGVIAGTAVEAAGTTAEVGAVLIGVGSAVAGGGAIANSGGGSSGQSPGMILPLQGSGNGPASLPPSLQQRIVQIAREWSLSHVPYGIGIHGGQGSSKAGADCSGSIWCIYSQSGLKYDYVPSWGFSKSCAFGQVPSNQSPDVGDVGVYPGHVVIYDPKAAPGMDVWSASKPGGPVFGPGNQGWYHPGPPKWYRYNPQGCKP